MRAALLAGAAVGILALGALGCGSSGGEDEPTTARAPKEFFGVVTQGPVTDRDLERMQQGNVGTLRLMIPWGALDTTADRGPLDYSGIDALVLGAAERQIKLLPMLYGTPSWVAEDLDGERCDPNCAAYMPRSAKALDAWHEFVFELVERYGPGGELWKEHPRTDPEPIRTWQIWNEQNSPTFYQPKVDPSSYNELLETSTDAIEAHDPNAEVVLGGMFGTPFKGKPPAISAADYLRQLYAIDGADENFDAVAAHPYAARLPKIEQQVDLLHDEIVRADDDAALWITEVGASSNEGEDCTEPCPLERGPEGHAELLRQVFEFMLAHRERWNVEGVAWYAWRDTSDPAQCAWCTGAGFFPEDEDSLDPKPAWDAFVELSGGS